MIELFRDESYEGPIKQGNKPQIRKWINNMFYNFGVVLCNQNSNQNFNE